MAVTSRQELYDYCLRALGEPAIEVNVAEEQVEDRIDEALDYYREFHYDAVELVYLKEQMKPSTLVIAGSNAASFAVNEKLTGNVSATTAVVHANISASSIAIKNTSNVFTVGERVTGNKTGTTAVVTSTTLGNLDNRYISLPDAVTGVNKVFPFSSRTRGIDLFDARYQILLNDLYSIQSTDIIYYTQVQTQLQLMNDLLVGQTPVRFNKHQNRLHVDMDWNNAVSIGDYIIIEAYRILDPNTFTDVYNDNFLKQYTTALIKRQWGINLKKFEGVQMPGGVTLNGQIIYNEAIEEIKELREKVESTYTLPVDMFVG